MNKNTKLILALASSLLLVGCGNSNSSSSPTDSGSEDSSRTLTDSTSSSNQDESSSSSEEEINLAIDEVSDILPGKTVQLVTKNNGVAVEATYEIVEGEAGIYSSISETGLFQAGAYEEVVTVKASYKGVGTTINISVVAPVLDDAKLNIPSSWKASSDVISEDETKEGTVSFEFVKDEAAVLVDTMLDYSVGLKAEGGKVYQVKGNATEAKFNYTKDLQKDVTVDDFNSDGNLASVINAASLEFFGFDEESGTYEFDPIIGEDEEETVDPIEELMYALGFIDDGFNTYTIQIDPETMAFKEIVAIEVDDEGYEVDRLELNITSIEELSITITGEKVSDGGTGEGGVEEPFEPDPVESSEEGE